MVMVMVMVMVMMMMMMMMMVEWWNGDSVIAMLYVILLRSHRGPVSGSVLG